MTGDVPRSDWDSRTFDLDGPSGLPVGDLPRQGPVTVDAPIPSRVLAIGAHPDDIEFGAGATLAKWAASGCQLHHLVLTDGSKGTWDPSADLDRLVADRADECRAAAAVIDGHPPGTDRVLFLGCVDGELVNGEDERRAVCRIIRTVRPDVILGHDPWRRYRLHPDHRNAGFLTIDALVAARDPHFFAELDLPPHRPKALLLWEADLPNHVESAIGFEGTKIDALVCHRSQYETTMGITAPSTDTPGRLDQRQLDQRSAFAGNIHHQLAAHGALAQMARGEAFHRIDDL